MEQVQDGVGATAGVVVVGEQDVDAGVPADLGGLEPVVPHAGVALVVLDDVQPEAVVGRGGRRRGREDARAPDCQRRGRAADGLEDTPARGPVLAQHDLLIRMTDGIADGW